MKSPLFFLTPLCLLFLATTPFANAQEGEGAYIAYTYAGQPATTSYTPQAAFTLNPMGGVTIDRSGTGVYAVQFANLATAFRDRTTSTEGEAGGRGHVQISAVDTPGAYCKTNGWGESGTTLVVNVHCYDAGGTPADARYTVLFLEPAINAGELGFVWANEPSNPSYTPAGTHAYNGAGGDVAITHTSTGFYNVRFEGMARYAVTAMPFGGGQVHVSGDGLGNAKCQVTGWNLDGDAYEAFVLCRTPGGSLTDARFTLMTLWPGTDVGTHAYAWAGQATAPGTYTPSSFYNNGRPVSVTPLGTGHYRVFFSGLTVFFGGQVQVDARMDPRTTCQAENWGPSSGNLRVDVRCYDETGSATNAQFVVSAFYGAAPTPGNTEVALNFTGFADGTLLVNELYTTQGIRFGDGVSVVACAAGNIVCSRSRSARNVAVPTETAEEFKRNDLQFSFAEDQNEIIVSLNSAVLDGIEREVTMKAKTPSGTTLATATGTVRGDPGWATRLRIATPGIHRVLITSRLPGATENDNQIIIDDLYYNDTTPAPPDDTPPTVRIWDVSSGEVFTESPVRFQIQAFDTGLDEVSFDVTRVSDGTFIQPPTTLCGTPATGACPGTFLQTFAIGLTAAGDYQITARATNTAGLMTTSSRTFTFEPPPPPPPAFVHKIEFNQSVTNRLYERNIFSPENVFIIPGKDLLVRYYLHSEEAPRAAYTASMRVEIEKSDGTFINQTIAPNAGTATADLVPLPADAGTARRDMLVTMRADLSRTLNFVLPGDWFEDAVFTEIELWEGVRNLSRAQIHDSGDNHSTLALQLVYVNDQQFLGLGTDNFNDNVRPFLEKAMPFSEVQILSERGFNFNGAVLLDLSPCAHLNFALSLYGDDFGTGLPDDTRLWWNKAILVEPGDLFGSSCTGIGQRPGRNMMSRFMGGNVGHEIGHNMGLRHVSMSHAEPGGVAWPYYHGAIGTPGGTFGIIIDPDTPPGPGSAGAWDLFLIDPCPTTDLTKRFAPGGCALMDDTTHTDVPHEMMSYGTNSSLNATSVPRTRGYWLSYDTYTQVYNRAESRTAAAPATLLAQTGRGTDMMAGKSAEGGPAQVLVVTGIIREDGTTQVMPLVGRAATLEEMARQQTGDYLVELIGEDGIVLASVNSAATEFLDEDTEITFIQALLPYVRHVKAVRISKNSTVVMEQTASLNAPEVQVLSPNGAEHFEGDAFQIQWQGSDADGDDLTYIVEYSPDNGATWETVRVVFAGQPTEFEVQTAGLADGIRGRIRVTASDGINVSRDESNGYFSVGPEPPVTSYDIYTVDVATGTPQRITFLDETDEYNPDWSPDGSRLVHDVTTFATDGTLTGQDLYITDPATGASTALAGGAGGNDAAWHPDGTQIVFDRCPFGTTPPVCEPALYRVPATGGTPTLVRTDAVDGDWAHTGLLVVFHQPSDGSIRARHLDSGREELVAPRGTNPVWSPDDKYIAYSDGGDVYRVRVNGSGKPKSAPQQLTTDPANDSQPSWHLSNNSLVFHSDRSGDFDLYTLTPGSSPVFLVGDTGSGDFDPAYAPDGSLVAYARFTGTAAPGAPKTGADASSEKGNPGQAPPASLQATSYPNPFNPAATIRFTLPQASRATVKVYDVLGREVATLVNGSMEAGTHAVRFDASHLPSGTYFYRIEAGREHLVRQLTLIK